MSDFEQLWQLKRAAGGALETAPGRLLLAPDLGARVFVELAGEGMHRLDLANVRCPDQPFNNYGGNNFWPAPEGGAFGFNYDGDTWRVQPAINNEPFALAEDADQERLSGAAGPGAAARKRTTLSNRAGTAIEVVMARTVRLAEPPAFVAALHPQATLSYVVADRLDILNDVSMDAALIACWTLEQFDAGPQTLSFASVDAPEQAINFDYYEHPGQRIRYRPRGFTYQTDGRQAGQIGVKQAAGARFIGFVDPARRLLCVRELLGPTPGRYFNIADNDQPAGPWSAADNYSIFNGPADKGFFELETIGGAIIENGRLRGSRLTSRTTFARLADAAAVTAFLDQWLG